MAWKHGSTEKVRTWPRYYFNTHIRSVLGVNRFPKPQYRRTTGKSWISPSQNVKTSPAVTSRIIPVYKKTKRWHGINILSGPLVNSSSSLNSHWNPAVLAQSSDRLKVPKSEQLELNAGRSCVVQMLVLQTSHTRLVFMPGFPASGSCCSLRFSRLL